VIPVIIAGDLLFKPLSALLVLLWARLSGTPLADLGFRRPPDWPVTILLGTVAGIALKFLMKAIVMPLLGAPPVNEAYQFLQGNSAALPGLFYAIIVGAGFGEETLFRGFFFERLQPLGRRAVGMVAIVALTSLVFGLAHYPDQGLPGTQQAMVVGLVYGAMYAATRSLALPIVTHIAFNLTALWMIYFGLETRIATSVL
jgi:uncharacterized protein